MSTEKNTKKGKNKKSRIYVPDTSAIIAGIVRNLINDNKIKRNDTIVIPEFVISELENQANRGREVGIEGLEELKEIRKLCSQKKIELKEAGRKPTMEEIQLARSGRIDALIRDIAKELNGVLITCDLIQAMSAEALGVEVIYVEHERIEKLTIEKYLTSDTMSLHLKEGCKPKAKRGKPGAFKLVEVDNVILTREMLEEFAREIMEKSRMEERAMVEISRKGATVVQLGSYRIAITRPPFSEAMEITLVRPIVKVTLDDYKLSEKLKKRLEEKAEGVLIAGPPGHGKTTLAQALAEFYASKGRVVKTMEQPRDLQVSEEITQYAPLEGDMAKTSDILLLVRPDYTIYDELRTTHDFRVFADMRLAGVGMVGVVHATQPIDAIQRFLQRVELGMVPHIVDTIIFVKDGKIEKVYVLDMNVRVPSGMTADDLARPIVEVIDFETGKLEYEIYTYGEQTVVMKVKEAKESTISKLAEERLTQMLRRYLKEFSVEIVGPNRAVLRVRKEDVPKIIGKEGKNIAKLEELVGIRLSVEPIVDTLKKAIPFRIKEASGSVIIELDRKMVGRNVDVYKGDEFLFSATVGKRAHVRIKKKSELGKKVLQAVALDNLRVLAD